MSLRVNSFSFLPSEVHGAIKGSYCLVYEPYLQTLVKVDQIIYSWLVMYCTSSKQFNVFTPSNNFQCFSCGVIVAVEYL